MQTKLPQPVLTIETKIWERSFREKTKVSKKVINKKFDFSEGHNFCAKNFGVTAYAGKLSTTFYIRSTQNP